MTQYQNPIYYKGPRLELVTVRAKDSLTWQAGQFARRTDSGLVLCKSNASSIQYVTAETQATSTSTSDVPVWKIPSAETQFIMGVTSGGVDTRALASYIGSNEGLAVNSCICTLSTGNDSTEVLHVEDILANKTNGYRGIDTSDLPGYLIVSVVQSALQAEGAGL